MSADLEQRLVALGAALDTPGPSDDMIPAIIARLPERGPARIRRVGRPLAIALAALLLLAGAAMALPTSRHAILRVLGLRGVVIERVPRLPSLPPGPGARLGLGERIPVSKARHAATFTALVPPGVTAAYLDHDLPGGRISLIHGRLLIMEFRGTGVPFVFKLVGPGTHIKMLRVNGGPGVYLSGAPHQLLVQTSNSEVVTDHVRLAGNVLIWQQGPVTIRVEGTHTLGQALAVAHSMSTTTPVATASAGCPVTKPNGPPPPPDALQNGGTPIAKASEPGWYGNGTLWTNLPWSTQFIRTPSGLLSTKIPWFRARPGNVSIDARPLHGPPARFTASVGEPAAYGRTGFSPSILAFGRTGCWVVHAHLAGKALDVVLRVYPATGKP